MAVITEGEKIIAIEPQQPTYEDAQVVDLKGHYIMPGLINLHVHLPGQRQAEEKQSDPKKLVKLMTSNNFLRKITVENVRRVCRDTADERRDDDPHGRRR